MGFWEVLKELIYVKRREQPWPASGVGHVRCHYRLLCFIHCLCSGYHAGFQPFGLRVCSDTQTRPCQRRPPLISCPLQLGSERGLGACCADVPRGGRHNLPSNMAKRGKSPRNMSGCRWNMVSMGFWSPTERGHGEPSAWPLASTPWCRACSHQDPPSAGESA